MLGIPATALHAAVQTQSANAARVYVLSRRGHVHFHGLGRLTTEGLPQGTRLHPTVGGIHSLAAFVRFLCSTSFFHSRTEGDPRMPCLSFSHGARSSVTPARDGYRPPCHQPPGDTDSRSIAQRQCTIISFCQAPHRWRLARSSSKQSRTGGVMATAHGHLGSRDELRLD